MIQHIPEILKVMTPFPKRIEHNTDLGEALALMDEGDFSHLPVVKDNEVVGLISRDAAILALEHPGHPEDQTVLTAEDVLDEEVPRVDAHEPLDAVLIKMRDAHLPAVVVQHKGKLAGIFTSSDVSDLLIAALHNQPLTTDPPDISA